MRQVDAQVEHERLLACLTQERLGLVDMHPVLFMHLPRLPITNRLGDWTRLLAQGEVDGACPRLNTLGLGVPL